MTLGQKIRKFRGWMPQAELARQLGRSRQAICNWEADRNHPDVPSLQKMAAIFGVKVDDMLSEAAVA